MSLKIVEELCCHKQDFIEEFKKIFFDDKPVPKDWIPIFYNSIDSESWSVQRLHIKSEEDFWDKWNKYKKLTMFK